MIPSENVQKCSKIDGRASIKFEKNKFDLIYCGPTWSYTCSSPNIVAGKNPEQSIGLAKNFVRHYKLQPYVIHWKVQQIQSPVERQAVRKQMYNEINVNNLLITRKYTE